MDRRVEAAFEKIAGNDQGPNCVRFDGVDQRLHFLRDAAPRNRIPEPLASGTVAEMEVGQHRRRAWLMQRKTLRQQMPFVEKTH